MTRIATGMLLAALAAGSGNAIAAQPEITNVSGGLGLEDIQPALNRLAPWFDKANQLCKQNDLSDCRIVLNVSVAAGDTKPTCELVDSTIKDSSIKAIYCKIVREALLPARNSDSAFMLRLPNGSAATDPGFGPSATGGKGAAITSTGGSLSYQIAPANQESNQTKATAPGTQKALGQAPGCSRAVEAMRHVFNQNGGKLNNAYQRSLLQHPYMTGDIRLSLTITNKGQASTVEVVSADASLVSSFLESVTVIVKSFDFGPAEKDTTCFYHLNFLPS